MTKDLLVESGTATIVEDPNTTPMSVRLPTREEKILPKEEVEEKNHHQGREGVGMIDMNEDPHGEARIRKGRISQGVGKEGQVIKELHKTKTSSSR